MVTAWGASATGRNGGNQCSGVRFVLCGRLRLVKHAADALTARTWGALTINKTMPANRGKHGGYKKERWAHRELVKSWFMTSSVERVLGARST
jgi:hypothetical protein